MFIEVRVTSLREEANFRLLEVCSICLSLHFKHIKSMSDLSSFVARHSVNSLLEPKVQLNTCEHLAPLFSDPQLVESSMP